ncbi:MAG: 30S ribosomal protein S17 [Phycisphaerales bacterium]
MTATTSNKKKASKVSTKVGIVESDKRDRTRQVVVPILSTHPKYGKIMRSRTVLHVHDEKNTSKSGDLVEIAPCRPMSRSKRWALVRVVKKNAAKRFQAVAAPGEEANDEAKKA